MPYVEIKQIKSSRQQWASDTADRSLEEAHGSRDFIPRDLLVWPEQPKFLKIHNYILEKKKKKHIYQYSRLE